MNINTRIDRILSLLIISRSNLFKIQVRVKEIGNWCKFVNIIIYL